MDQQMQHSTIYTEHAFTPPHHTRVLRTTRSALPLYSVHQILLTVLSCALLFACDVNVGTREILRWTLIATFLSLVK